MCLTAECARDSRGDSVYETVRTRRLLGRGYRFTRALFSQVFPIRFFLQCPRWYKGNSTRCMPKNIAGLLLRIVRIVCTRSKRARAVKGFDSKSNGLSPRRFESCRLRAFWPASSEISQRCQGFKNLGQPFSQNSLCSTLGFHAVLSFDGGKPSHLIALAPLRRSIWS